MKKNNELKNIGKTIFVDFSQRQVNGSEIYELPSFDTSPQDEFSDDDSQICSETKLTYSFSRKLNFSAQHQADIVHSALVTMCRYQDEFFENLYKIENADDREIFRNSAKEQLLDIIESIKDINKFIDDSEDAIKLFFTRK